MPLELQAPPGAPRESGGSPSAHVDPGTVVIGLVNNMPDSALEGTELQFKRLLAAAAGSRIVRLRLASLPQVPRGADARTRARGSQPVIGPWNNCGRSRPTRSL